MLIEFSVANFRSIGEKQTLSLVPAPKQRDYPENIITAGKHEVLNMAAIYGANASGKSNLIRGLGLMAGLVEHSLSISSIARLPYDPFLLREGWDEKPTYFEIVFIADDIRYRYGYEINNERVVREWLFRKITSRETLLFEREDDVIDVSSGFSASKKLIDTVIEATRVNALFLSMCDTFNVDDALRVMSWFRDLTIIDGLDTEDEQVTTVQLWQNEEYRDKIRQYLIALEIGIVDLEIVTQEFNESDLRSDMPNDLRNQIIQTFTGRSAFKVDATHRYFDAKGNLANHTKSWNWHERESSGAQKALQLSGPILNALIKGGVLVIDEMEAKMHPILTLNTIRLFLNPVTNPNHAQLVFATHDTNLLTYSTLRRDQIYFTEKNKWESTELYSLSDFVYIGEKNGVKTLEKERPDTDKEKRYLEGRYGAIPFLGAFEEIIKKGLWQNEEK
ncbi:MAG: ATP-binding protein [Bacteroidia bacterium]|jgi:hypothetical protein|nr:ATP-binding protein [Bacteroidia bacterium]